jgi:pimeloyl-ACP methyl ester carboxylesterase
MKKVFIIHGWTYSTDAWTKTRALLSAKGIESVMLEVPGLTVTSDKVWTLPEYVEWLKGKLAGEQNVVLVGHSNGGRIALSYAAQSPQELGKLILIDAAGIRHTEFLLQMKRAVFGMIAKIGKVVTRSALLRKIFYRLIGARDYERATPTMRETMKNMLAVDLRSELPCINVPALIIWGAKDTATPVEDAEVMKQGIKGSNVFIIEDAGHSPHKTHPELVVEKIAAFL